MSSPTCDRAALVEAMLDRRLGPTEQAATERHLKTCSSCTALLCELTSLREMLRAAASPVSPLEHQRARLALLRQGAAPSARKRRPAALLVAALVLLPAAVWAAVSPQSPFRLVDQRPAPTPQSGAPQQSDTRKHAHPKPTPSTALQGRPPPTAATSELPSSPSTPQQPEARDSTPVRALAESGKKRTSAATPTPAQRASQDFAGAMSALARGDFSAGASKLRNFASAHPRDPRVEDAIYLEAVALERAGRLSDARTAGLHYLTLYPDGAHRAQAHRILGD